MSSIRSHIVNKLESQVIDLIIPRVLNYLRNKSINVSLIELYQAIGINVHQNEVKNYTQPNIVIMPAPTTTTISAPGIDVAAWKDGLYREMKSGFILKPQNGNPSYVCIGISTDSKIMRPLTLDEEMSATNMKIPLLTSVMASIKKVEINGHSVTTDNTPPGQPVSILFNPKK